MFSQENVKHTGTGKLRWLWIYGRNIKVDDRKRMVI